MLAFVAAAHAHPGTLAHLHAPEVSALGVVVFWLAVGITFACCASRYAETPARP